MGFGTYFIVKYNNPDGIEWEKGDIITVGIDTGRFPYGDVSGDEITGIDSDILRAVFLNMDLDDSDYRFKAMDFDSILEGIASGACTIGASAMSKNPHLIRYFATTDAYCIDHLSVVTLKDNPESITLSNLGSMRIAVMDSGNGNAFIDESFDADDKPETIQCCDPSDMIAAIQDGRADCLVVEDNMAKRMCAITSSDGELALEIGDIPVEFRGTSLTFALNFGDSMLSMEISEIVFGMLQSPVKNAVKDVTSYYLAHIGDEHVPSFWDFNDITDYDLSLP